MSLVSFWSVCEEMHLFDNDGGATDVVLEDARGRRVFLLRWMRNGLAYRYCLHYHCILLIIVYLHLSQIRQV